MARAIWRQPPRRREQIVQGHARQVGDGDLHPPHQFGQHHLAFFPPTTEKMTNLFGPSIDLPPSREVVKSRVAQQACSLYVPTTSQSIFPNEPVMADQIVITEKFSQAKDVRAAVGSRYGDILPAEGHLLDLLEPEDVVPEWKRWSPILLRPEGLYGTRPAQGDNKAAKLKVIREALRTAKRVWLATDCDREGQLIGQEILEHYEYRGQVMRVLFTAQDQQTIRDAFGQAKPNAEYARLYAAAVARRQADQIYNLSLTRTATVILGQGARRVIGVGRVKTPTLAIVCKREWKSGTLFPSLILKSSPPRKSRAASSRCGTRRRIESSGLRSLRR